MKNRQLLSVIAAGVLSMTAFNVAQATVIDSLTEKSGNVLSAVYNEDNAKPGIFQQLQQCTQGTLGRGTNYAACIAGLKYNSNYVTSVAQTSASSGYSDIFTVTLGAEPYVPSFEAGKVFTITSNGASGFTCTYTKASGTAANAQGVDLEAVTSAQMGSPVSAFGTMNMMGTAADCKGV